MNARQFPFHVPVPCCGIVFMSLNAKKLKIVRRIASAIAAFRGQRLEDSEMAGPPNAATSPRNPFRFHERRGKKRLRQCFDAKIVHETVVVPL